MPNFPPKKCNQCNLHFYSEALKVISSLSQFISFCNNVATLSLGPKSLYICPVVSYLYWCNSQHAYLGPHRVVIQKNRPHWNVIIHFQYWKFVIGIPFQYFEETIAGTIKQMIPYMKALKLSFKGLDRLGCNMSICCKMYSLSDIYF